MILKMRIKLIFENHHLTLPIHYNHILQGVIYNHLSPQTATKLHEEGFQQGNRVFRQFTFSNLIGNTKVENGYIQFRGPINWWISSPQTEILSEIASASLQKALAIAGHERTIKSIEVCPTPTFSELTQIKMLSPMTMYSTLTTPDGRKKTYYYSPFEEEFTTLIEKNLKRKYLAYYPESDPNAIQLKIAPKGIQRHHERIIKYKDFVIKGWSGQYQLEGSPEAIEFAWLTGLGGKNAQGLGCWEVLS